MPGAAHYFYSWTLSVSPGLGGHFCKHATKCLCPWRLPMWDCNHSQTGKQKWKGRRNYEWLNDDSLRIFIQRPSTEIKFKIFKEFGRFLVINVMEKVLVSHLTIWPILLPLFLTALILWPLEQLLTYSFNDKKAFLVLFLSFLCVWKMYSVPFACLFTAVWKTKLILICKKFIKSLILKNVFENQKKSQLSVSSNFRNCQKYWEM